MADISALEAILSSVVPNAGFVLDNRTVLSRLKFIEQYTRNVPYVSGSPEQEDSELSWADYLFMGGNTPEKLAALYHDTSKADGNLLPHQAFLLALLTMLETHRAFVNYFPGAHRDLYYRRLLALQEHPAEPSQLAVSIVLKSSTPELMLPAGTLLTAGQDSQGNAIEFGLDDDLLVNQSTWSDLRWCLPSGDRTGAGTSAILYGDQQAWPENGQRLFDPVGQDQAILTGRMLAAAALTNDPANNRVFHLGLAGVANTAGLLAHISGGDEWLPLTLTSTDNHSIELTLPAGSGEVSPPDGLPGAEFTVPVIRLSRQDGQAVPAITSVSVDSVVLGRGDYEDMIITPFGYSDEAQQVEDMQLYLGVSGLQPGQTLSLFWQLNSPQPLTVSWQYLAKDNRWQELGSRLVDNTLGLLQSGVWSTVLPEDASDSAPAMPSGRYWVRAEIVPVNTTEIVPVNTTGATVAHYPWLTGLVTNGMTATLCAVASLESAVVATRLPAGTVRQLVVDRSGVSRVQQPWASWGGRPPESAGTFFTRVAQRLSHRNRALTWRDLVMLLKTAFPDVFDVMTPSEGILTTVPALTEQKLIAIPLVSAKDNDDALRPLFNAAKLETMSRALQELASLWQNIRVENPRYRDVRLVYQVAFCEGVNPAWADRELREALTTRYMPWSTGTAASVSLANRVDYYEVIATLQQQPYVDHVVSLTLDSVENSVQGNDDEVLILCWTD
ncbi:hypothetical protein WJ95_28415 [Burkholderia ubonensis]|uniref:hypothetical protein n=1 Tax=Burkholderia ubonensis TaxID=101571 RepID=UPI000756132E|nr:hypothetical protein [Burkholderia ubonensis]KVQ00509.1 hypothetical protein WJ95_28415 [Burkholderia ubonensis]